MSVDGSNDKTYSSPTQHGGPFSQDIYQTVAFNDNLQINNVTSESGQHKPDELSLDADNFASKLFIMQLASQLPFIYHVTHSQILYIIMQLILSNWWMEVH